MKLASLYQDVTDKIIADLEAGTVPWTKPWRLKKGNGGGFLPYNYATGRTYSGINIPILWAESFDKLYDEPAWLTYRQATELGGQVQAGQKATHIVFTRQRVVEDAQTKEERLARMLRVYAVFNVAQVDGLPKKEKPARLPCPEDNAQWFMDATGAHIIVGGDRACYIPSADIICMPPQEAFEHRGHYLATALHELVHWTGAKRRLDRDLGSKYRSEGYAAEELVAEFGAAFLCAHLGIEGQLRHADYIASWLRLLKKDRTAIFTASSKASQAADYLRAFSDKAEEAA